MKISIFVKLIEGFVLCYRIWMHNRLNKKLKKLTMTSKSTGNNKKIMI